MTPLNPVRVREAIQKLEKETGLDLGAAVLGSVEVGASYILNEGPAEYLRLLQEHPKRKRKDRYKNGFFETVSFGTDTGNFQFCGYDKGREMADRRQEIPPLFTGRNVLKLEYRIIRRRGIKAKFHRDLSAYDLFDQDIYRALLELYFEDYKAIIKAGRRVHIDTTKPLTPAKLEKLTAEAYRQRHPEEYMADLQRLQQAGTLTPKNLERIRARDRRQGRDFAFADTSPLIAELDARVFNSAGLQ
jgi:hypothetical protein